MRIASRFRTAALALRDFRLVAVMNLSLLLCLQMDITYAASTRSRAGERLDRQFTYGSLPNMIAPSNQFQGWQANAQWVLQSAPFAWQNGKSRICCLMI